MRQTVNLALLLTALLAFALGVRAFAAGGDSTAGGSTSAAGTTPTKITVGVLNVSDAAPLFLAIADGTFARHGLSVETTPAPGAAQATSGLVSGDMQFAFGSYVPFILAAQRGVQLRIAAPADDVNDAFSRVVVAKDSPLRTVADLKGKRIAVSALINFGTLGIQESLKAAGVDPKSVTFVTFPFPNMMSALEHGQVDAAWLVEPFLTQARDSGNTRDLFDPFGGTMQGVPAAGFMMTAAYAKANPDVVSRFKRAMAEASRRAAADPATVRRIIPTFTKIPESMAAKIGLPAYTAVLDPAKLQHLADLMASDGLLASRFDVSVFFGD
ncbi:MAG: ABC transporter substrate-binding protein [Burkholderiaceae bacterium]|nr:ABC transporter substrate-binding protein [Burkholderiaceae bacterium]